MPEQNLNKLNHTLELVIATHFTIKNVVQANVPIEKILGIDQAYKSRDLRTIVPPINLIAFHHGSLYEIIQHKKIWELEIQSQCFTHLQLLVLPNEMDALELQKIILVINSIHCNRSLSSPNEVIHQLTHNTRMKKALRESYEIHDPILHLPRLLGANSFNPDHARRVKNKIILELAKNNLEGVWNDFANENSGVPMLEEIFTIFPRKERNDLKNFILKRLEENKGSLKSIWRAIKKVKEANEANEANEAKSWE